jgi:predicted nucleotidyltransferase
MSILDIHRRSLATSTALSRYYWPNLITPLQVIRVLNAIGVQFVLVGTHALGGWMNKPRTTSDVDVLVAVCDAVEAVDSLLAAFPRLKLEDHHGVARLLDPESPKAAIKVLKAVEDLLQTALMHTCEVEFDGVKYRIPSLETALALKFAPLVRLSRGDALWYLHAHDFISIAKMNPDIDLDQLAELGDLVYLGGGKEIVEKLGQARRGEMMTL